MRNPCGVLRPEESEPGLPLTQEDDGSANLQTHLLRFACH
jgi:hypothetical protein